MLVHHLHSQTGVDILVVAVQELRMIQMLKELLGGKGAVRIIWGEGRQYPSTGTLMYNKYIGGKI